MTTQKKNIVLIDLKYPYGKTKVYMNGSLVAIAAVLMAMGHRVNIIDFNIDQWGDERVQALLENADLIGISLIGSPYFESAHQFVKLLNASFPNKPVMIGGQVVEKLEPYQFKLVFAGTNAVQYRDKIDLASQLDVSPADIPSPFAVSFVPVWEAMGGSRLELYLSTETTLVNAQGCIFPCHDCAAAKLQKQQWMPEDLFYQNLTYLARKAKSFGLRQLRFYMSDLDAFQNQDKIVMQLNVLARVQKETGMDIQVRCLSSVKTFVHAARDIPNLAELCRRAGLYCIGFGIDGTKLIWGLTGKRHNNDSEILEAFKSCREFGIETQALIVLGYPADTFRSLMKLLFNACVYAFKFRADIRPYVNKHWVPGNDGWRDDEAKAHVILADIGLFYNLDFAACASKLTHPRMFHRWMTNFTYLSLIAMFKTLGRCQNNPLFPQGSKGFGGQIARSLNRHMPFDR